MLEVKRYGTDNPPILFIGNKCDMKNRVISHEVASEFAVRNGLMYIETSSKMAINVNEAFLNLTKAIIAKRYNIEMCLTYSNFFRIERSKITPIEKSIVEKKKVKVNRSQDSDSVCGCTII